MEKNKEKMKTKDANLGILLERKNDLDAALENVRDKLRWIYGDSCGTYIMEFINSHQVSIKFIQYGQPIEIVMPNDLFEDMCNFYLKRNEEEE